MQATAEYQKMGFRAGVFFLIKKKYLESTYWSGKNWNESTGE